jgi:hypothetical protein
MKKKSLLKRLAEKPVKSKKIIKEDKMVVEIKESKPVKETVSYFKKELEEAKKAMFFK